MNIQLSTAELSTIAKDTRHTHARHRGHLTTSQSFAPEALAIAAQRESILLSNTSDLILRKMLFMYDPVFHDQLLVITTIPTELRRIVNRFRLIKNSSATLWRNVETYWLLDEFYTTCHGGVGIVIKAAFENFLALLTNTTETQCTFCEQYTVVGNICLLCENALGSASRNVGDI